LGDVLDFCPVVWDSFLSAISVDWIKYTPYSLARLNDELCVAEAVGTDLLAIQQDLPALIDRQLRYTFEQARLPAHQSYDQ